MFTARALGYTRRFLFEKRNKPYVRYGEVSIAEENLFVSQDSRQGIWLCRMAATGGA